MTPTALITVENMYDADHLAIEAGTPSLTLMENAGEAVVQEVVRRWKTRPVSVLCGPGNNGGDGFVVARLLRDLDWPVCLALLGPVDALKGDARENARRWHGPIVALTADVFCDAPLVIDALFGAGLTRPLEGPALSSINTINQRRLECVAVDIPSGLHGNTGERLGAAPKCGLTVTFFRAKPGHFLQPGRALAGELVIADIGIPSSVLDVIKPTTYVNNPDLWGKRFPRADVNAHKYTRGHVVIRGGDDMTGAAQLAALGARRSGAGLVTISASVNAAGIYRFGQPGTIVSAASTVADFSTFLENRQVNVIVIGPGMGVSPETQEFVLAALNTDKKVVVDADAISAFRDTPQALISRLNENHILTPHEGEFKRLFNVAGSKTARAREAALQSGATILLKGADTVVAAPTGQVAINYTGTPYLATAGSGDVLSGIIAGLLAQGMAPFDAGSAGAWLHGRAGEEFGPGLIAEDLTHTLPDVLAELLARLEMTL